MTSRIVLTLVIVLANYGSANSSNDIVEKTHIDAHTFVEAIQVKN